MGVEDYLLSSQRNIRRRKTHMIQGGHPSNIFKLTNNDVYYIVNASLVGK